MSTSRLSKLTSPAQWCLRRAGPRPGGFYSRMPESARDRNPPRRIGGHTGSGTGIARLKSPRVISARLASTRAENSSATTALTEMRFELGLTIARSWGSVLILSWRNGHGFRHHLAGMPVPVNTARGGPVRWDCHKALCPQRRRSARCGWTCASVTSVLVALKCSPPMSAIVGSGSY